MFRFFILHISQWYYSQGNISSYYKVNISSYYKTQMSKKHRPQASYTSAPVFPKFAILLICVLNTF